MQTIRSNTYILRGYNIRMNISLSLSLSLSLPLSLSFQKNHKEILEKTHRFLPPFPKGNIVMTPIRLVCFSNSLSICFHFTPSLSLSHSFLHVFCRHILCFLHCYFVRCLNLSPVLYYEGIKIVRLKNGQR